jgi:hypothetical protein
VTRDPRRYDPAGYERALRAQRASPVPVPARITAALDLRGLYGPDVDTACGAREPDVDLWESGEASPTPHQVELLAALTRFPVAFFYTPYTDGGMPAVVMCGPRGCLWVPGRPDVAPPVPTRQGALW